jgi:hypothetical protein
MIQLRLCLIRKDSILLRRHSASPSLSQTLNLNLTPRYIKVNNTNSANPVKMNINITPIRTDRARLDFNSPSIFCEDFLNLKDRQFLMSSKGKDSLN